MAKAMVEVLVDDLDGSEAVDTVRRGWNGEWRELDLSKRNAAALERAVGRYWAAGRPVSASGQASRRRKTSGRSTTARRDPKVIRAWAISQGIEVPSRGRIPGRRRAPVQRGQPNVRTPAHSPARQSGASDSHVDSCLAV